MQLSDNNNLSMLYDVKCSCGEEDLYIELEYILDDENNNRDIIEMRFHGKIRYFSWKKSINFFAEKWFRIISAFKILIKGEVDANFEFIFQGENQIKDFLKSLNNGLRLLKQRSEQDVSDI